MHPTGEAFPTVNVAVARTVPNHPTDESGLDGRAALGEHPCLLSTSRYFAVVQALESDLLLAEPLFFPDISLSRR